MIFEAFGMASIAIADDHFDIVGGYVFTPDIAVIIILAVKWAYFLCSHANLLVYHVIVYTA